MILPAEGEGRVFDDRFREICYTFRAPNEPYSVNKISMDKTKIRVIIVLLFIIFFGATYFSVLAAEENKRLAKNKSDQEQFLNSIRETDLARKSYLESVLQSRTASKQNMELAKQQYEESLKNQPALIQQNQKQATTTVKQLVPVASSSNVGTTQTAKPKSTRTTKTS